MDLLNFFPFVIEFDYIFLLRRLNLHAICCNVKTRVECTHYESGPEQHISDRIKCKAYCT